MPVLAVAIGAFLIAESVFERVNAWPVGTHVEPDVFMPYFGLAFAGLGAWMLRRPSKWQAAVLALILTLGALCLVI